MIKSEIIHLLVDETSEAIKSISTTFYAQGAERSKDWDNFTEEVELFFRRLNRMGLPYQKKVSFTYSEGHSGHIYLSVVDKVAGSFCKLSGRREFAFRGYEGIKIETHNCSTDEKESVEVKWDAFFQALEEFMKTPDAWKEFDSLVVPGITNT